MAVARMRKITILAFQELEEPLFERLRDTGLMHVTKSTVADTGERLEEVEMEIQSPEYVERLAQLSVIKSYFERYHTIEKSFIDMFTGKKPEMLLSEFKDAVAKYDIPKIFAKVQQHEEYLNDTEKQVADLEQRLQSLKVWNQLDIPLAQIGKTQTCHTCLAVVPLSGLDVPDIVSSKVHYKVIWELHGQAGIWLVVFSDDDNQRLSMDSVLSATGGSRVDLTRIAGDYADVGFVYDICQKIEERLDILRKEQETILSEDAEMAENLLDILALTDYYLDRKNLDEVRKDISRTRFTLVIEGFVKAAQVEAFKNQLSDFTGIAVIDEEPSEDDDVPVYLENHPLIRPFEVVTNIFGYPSYHELDPTPALAPFFWVFFGMCLGDAVYGIILSLFAWSFLKTQNLEDDKMMKLLMYCGVSTFFAGAVMGSWLGDLPTAFFPGTLFERITSSIALLDPINDPLTLLLVSLAFGIVHIWAGIIVKMIGTIRDGDLIGGLWEHGSWVVFLPGLVLWGISQTGVVQSDIPLYIMAAGALLVMYAGARNQPNILLKPISGVGGLYSIVNYFSDVLSYARILALGLASAIIGVVVNTISQLVIVMAPKIGWVFVPAILAVGHMLNLVINALGSFIHSGRLQFVEFFTKFFEGGGTPFNPLKRVGENVSLTD